MDHETIQLALTSSMIVVGALVAFLMLGHKLKIMLRELLGISKDGNNNAIMELIKRVDKHEEGCERDRRQTHDELAKLVATVNNIQTSIQTTSDSSHRSRKELHEKVDNLAQRVARIEQQLNERP